MIDGGPGAEPGRRVDAWLVTDAKAELSGAIRRLAAEHGAIASVAEFHGPDLLIRPKRVVHTSHPAYGYLIQSGGKSIVWAPEFFVFPRWAADATIMFAEAAGWDHPIRFAGGVGGHLDVMSVARAARRYGVSRLVFSHLGRPTLRALDDGKRPSFGEFARDGQAFVIRSGHPAPR